MRTALECIPCFARQALDASRLITEDPALHEQILREVLRWTAEMDLEQSPPTVAQRLHRRLRQLTGCADPYRRIKDRFNRLALEAYPDLKTKVRQAEDPLWLAMRLAIAGNVIDLGVSGDLTEEDVLQSIDNVLHEPFSGDIEEFRRHVRRANSILYLADNAGEIVLDRLLIEQLPVERVTLAVRGRPILNDVTRVDAETAGLTDIVTVIDNGSDAPGTLLPDCSREFRRRFEQADLIIAKGQGNFETLSDTPADIFFLLKAKCPVIAANIGLPVGTHIARRRKAAADERQEEKEQHASI
ncbi:MAG: damage-control phosphatase ARMT1 family protein [Phycisphaerae bacterium]